MRRWLADSLSKRLFWLMWVALVVSHVMAYAAVRIVSSGHDGSGWPVKHPRSNQPADLLNHLPTFPSLPPTPGLPDNHGVQHRRGDRPDRSPAEARADAQGEPPAPLADATGSGSRPANPGDAAPRRGGLPTEVLLLDYGVRLLVIALAAWLGSRWLAAPMRRLVVASRALGDSMGREATSPPLDEQRGTREVRETAQVFNGMARQLREQFQARGLMVAAMSHDLRTPLTRLRMRLESMTVEPDQQQRCVADIREMNELIDTVLELFRHEGPAAAEALQSTDVGALVQSLTDDLIEQGQAVSFSGDSAVTLTHPAALRRVVGNLVSNALRYGGRADVSVTADAATVRIAVDDDGPGIAPAQLEAVFQPFYRVEASRNRHTGGAGLGLYIARSLAHSQGAKVTLANRAEGGLRAEVLLPLR